MSKLLARCLRWLRRLSYSARLADEANETLRLLERQIERERAALSPPITAVIEDRPDELAEQVLQAQRAWLYETLKITLGFIHMAARRHNNAVMGDYLRGLNLITDACGKMLAEGHEIILIAWLSNIIEEA